MKFDDNDIRVAFNSLHGPWFRNPDFIFRKLQNLTHYPGLGFMGRGGLRGRVGTEYFVGHALFSLSGVDMTDEMDMTDEIKALIVDESVTVPFKELKDWQ